MNASHKTAIARKALSAPMSFLQGKGLLSGVRMLDYGCGKGFDADALGMEKYDLNFVPRMPKGKYRTVTCIYVLNVVEDPEERRRVEDRIIQLLAPGGRAFIAVRDDIPEGSRTQWAVEPGGRWDMIKHVKGRFRVYEHKGG